MDWEAEQEGFHELTEQSRDVVSIKNTHEERYRKLLKKVREEVVFEKTGITM